MKLNKPIQLNNPRSSTNSKNPKNFVPLIIVSCLLIFALASPAISQAFDFDGQLKGITITDPDSGNAPPNAVITHTTVSETPFQVNFDAGGSTDSDGSITEYRWDFGDGTTGTGAAVSHEFTTEGAFPVTLTVVDDMGGVALSQVNIDNILTLTVSNLSPSTYQLANLSSGDQFYTDRTYVITAIPQALDGLLGIRTANNDKTSTAATFISFTTNKISTVYVCYDSRTTTYPSWLTGDFAMSDSVVETSDVSFTLWQKSFPAGQISLPGNFYGGAVGVDSNYFVLIE